MNSSIQLTRLKLPLKPQVLVVNVTIEVDRKKGNRRAPEKMKRQESRARAVSSSLLYVLGRSTIVEQKAIHDTRHPAIIRSLKTQLRNHVNSVIVLVHQIGPENPIDARAAVHPVEGKRGHRTDITTDGREVHPGVEQVRVTGVGEAILMKEGIVAADLEAEDVRRIDAIIIVQDAIKIPGDLDTVVVHLHPEEIHAGVGAATLVK